MKHNILLIISIVAFIGLMASCSGMNDNVDKWLTGEKVYAPKVDSSFVNAGRERLKLNFTISAQRIKYLRLYWNNKNDSTDIQVNGQTGVFSTIINNLKEGDYLFNVYSVDYYGNRSLMSEANGVVYGDSYMSSLTNRNYNKYYTYFDPSTSTLYLYWGNPAEGAVKTQLTYTDTDGKTVVRDIPNSETTTTLTNVKGDLKVNSFFIPDETSIDTFPSLTPRVIPVYYEKRIDRSNWKIINYSSIIDDWYPGWGGDASHVIDGDVNTCWHTIDGSGLPHYFIIDMGQNENISSFGMYRRMGGVSATPGPTFMYAADGELSDPTFFADPGWKTFTSAPLDNIYKGEQFAHGLDVVKARYILFITTEGNAYGYYYLSEIYAYTPLFADYIK
jgi:hypothetical protein